MNDHFFAALHREAVAAGSMVPPLGAYTGPNLLWRPAYHGCANLPDARAYAQRLAARGERDES
jgi:hypothetical protein